MLTIPNDVVKSHVSISTPLPWRMTSFAVGGLWAVGFGARTDLLLVASSNGRGVFDALSGERVARDRSDYSYDEDSETVAGIGPLAASRIELNGTGGGIATQRILPLASQDGWAVAIGPAPRGNESIFLRTPTTSGAGWSKIAETEEVRAIGFAPTDRTLVVAEPHTLHLWCR